MLSAQSVPTVYRKLGTCHVTSVLQHPGHRVLVSEDKSARSPSCTEEVTKITLSLEYILFFSSCMTYGDYAESLLLVDDALS
jgi:hypothetical protein